MDSIARSATSSPTDPVNLTEKMFALSGSIIFRQAFGKSFRGSEFDRGKFYELVHDAETVAGALSYDECFPGFGWIVDWISGHSLRVERVFRKLDSLFQLVIDEHLKPGRTNQEEDIIDVMLGIEKEQTEEYGHAWLTKNHIKAILLRNYCRMGNGGAWTEVADINMEEKTGNCLTLSKKIPLLLVPSKYLGGQAAQ
ncbi:hypothetical protein V6N13_035608 [Hibiscus sabdariffa]